MALFSDKVVIYGPAYPMNLTPLWVAHDKGFFREEGLDVTLEAVLGIPDAAHPRHQWRKAGKVVFASPGGSPMFRSVREKRGPEDTDINVISIANCTAHVFVAQPHIEDPSQLRGKRLGADRKGGSSIDATIVLRHFGVHPDDVTWVDSRGKPPDTERYRLALFEKGELDAVCCDPPHWNMAVRMGGRRLTSARDLFALPEAGLSTNHRRHRAETGAGAGDGPGDAAGRRVRAAQPGRNHRLCAASPDPRQPRARRNRLGRGPQRLGSGAGRRCV
jgi:ABC-type nitrate/sulfonate/bicarbonate transport system substrate-binding protein